MANKGYTIVETSKMSATYNSALINVEYKSNGALENGRLVTIASDKVRYALTADAKVYLHASVEKMYDTSLSLADFRAEDGDYVRIMGMIAGDEFETSAISGTLVKGDKVILETATGKLIKSASPVGTENFIAEVIDVSRLGFRALSLAMDNQPSVTVRVIKA